MIVNHLHKLFASAQGDELIIGFAHSPGLYRDGITIDLKSKDVGQIKRVCLDKSETIALRDTLIALFPYTPEQEKELRDFFLAKHPLKKG